MSIPKSRFRKIDFYAKRPGVTVDEAPYKISESYDFPWWLTSNVLNPSPSRGAIRAAASGTLSQSWSSRAGRNVKSRDPEFLKVVMKLGEKDVFERWEVVLSVEVDHRFQTVKTKAKSKQSLRKRTVNINAASRCQSRGRIVKTSMKARRIIGGS
ncbi:hypothetical protein B0H14DRAFT_2562887 [Mycena olivaceomarginata]|nr:hypothetical protein B0H14DRAFT_2562887 [Mycena olivaceomarginata]